MGDQSTNTPSSSLVPEGFRALDTDDESEADSLHMESAQDITLPFSAHLPDFLPNLDDDETVTVELNLDCNTVELTTEELQNITTIKAEGIDTNNLLPVTPTKPQDAPSALDPVTPTANLKLLMSALSPEIRSMEKRQKSKALFNAIVQAASQENLELQQNGEMAFEVDVETSSQGEPEEFTEDGEKPSNRKSKSLGLLCQRFLSKYPDYPADGQAMEISLDSISKELCVERRRIYDIVNVLESVEMVQRQAKNKYLWHGKTYLVQTLVKLKCLGERNDYANQMEQLKKLQVERDYQQELSNGGGRSKKQPLKDFTNTAGQMLPTGKMRFLEDDPNARKEKSLGVMSQKFIMLFLVSKNQLVTLDTAARVLIGDINYEIIENAKFKTKVRRLYDIANILTSLGMIKKVHIHERRGRKPAFRWIGPNPDISDIDLSQYDLQSKPVFRHSHFPPPVATATSAPTTSHLAPIRPKSRGKKTSSFTRHHSFNVMRKPTQPEGDDNRHCSSAPSSPAKVATTPKTSEKFQKEFNQLRTKYPDCMSKLFAACNIEKERMQEEEEQLVMTLEDADKLQVSDQLQTARKVLNMEESENADTSQAADSEQRDALNNLLTFVDSLNSALREGDTMRRSKRTIKQPLSDEYEYQPVVKRSKMEHQALAALQKCNDDPSGQKTHITLQRVKTENLTKRVMSELTTGKSTLSTIELPPDLAMLQESVSMAAKPVKVEIRKGSAFVPVAGSTVKKVEVKLSTENQGALRNIVIKHLPVSPVNTSMDSKPNIVIKHLPASTSADPKPNLPLIRHPTKTIKVPADFVKKLLCHEKLDVASDKRTEDSKSKTKDDGKGVIISTKPVIPAAVQSAADHSSIEIIRKTNPMVVSPSSSVPKTDKSLKNAHDEVKAVVSSPNSPPFQPICMGETKDTGSDSSQSSESSQSQTDSSKSSENSQSSSLNIPLSPYLHLCQGSSRGVSPLHSRCSSVGTVGELDHMFGTDSQVATQCRSKSVSPVTRSPIGTSASPVVGTSTNITNTIPTSCIQRCMITTAGMTPTIATPVRLGLPVPITHVTTPRQVTLIPGAPTVTQSSIGRFMPMSSVLPPHPAAGHHIPMPSTLYNPMHPCISSPATYVPTTHPMVSPINTSSSTPAGLITPTSSAQCTSDINFYRTPTTLPLGSIQPRTFLTGQGVGIPTPYVLSGVGGSIGQLQPVSRKLTLALPPASQS